MDNRKLFRKIIVQTDMKIQFMAITNYVLDIKNRWSAKSKQICAEPAEISEISVGSVFCYILNADKLKNELKTLR